MSYRQEIAGGYFLLARHVRPLSSYPPITRTVWYVL